MIVYYEYPSCSTCKKATKFLTDNGIEVKTINIKDNPPSKEELRQFIEKSGMPIKKFFNTSGQLYRDQKVKEQLETADFETALDILATSGMMMKRPILVTESNVINGFKAEQWEKELL
ncbi:Spx/MgsR family RNA polymerase-binding regulatory protein [Culicoidibacter larvae]|uniref:Spx/MgsR family RNA polymerase-binding regulatory protein n=1 Tax=Culicoidibacter larvae TaxID=2579976 RepID=A0A5R8QBU1_9FIRM|nr:Spx/MgsR family RNA polymerase-binding regulatory protein [Culicoidibacter larvae]TLG72572.1 Spx/MgsR family RNA polymerase-binding regulatory protein [Culicoidibacter larvae]